MDVNGRKKCWLFPIIFSRFTYTSRIIDATKLGTYLGEGNCFSFKNSQIKNSNASPTRILTGKVKVGEQEIVLCVDLHKCFVQLKVIEYKSCGGLNNFIIAMQNLHTWTGTDLQFEEIEIFTNNTA